MTASRHPLDPFCRSSSPDELATVANVAVLEVRDRAQLLEIGRDPRIGRYLLPSGATSSPFVSGSVKPPSSADTSRPEFLYDQTYAHDEILRSGKIRATMRVGSSVKVTYSLPSQLAEQVREAVGKGLAPSASAFVARVLGEALRREREVLLAEEFRQAAADPDFLAACEEVEREFEAADAETASMIR